MTFEKNESAPIEKPSEDLFWEVATAIAPKTVNLFSRWFNNYKSDVNWSRFFLKEVFFHDLPVDVQIAIMNSFFRWCNGVGHPCNVCMLYLDHESAMNDIEDNLMRIEKSIIKKSIA